MRFPTFSVLLSIAIFAFSSLSVYAAVSGTVYRELPINGAMLNTYGVQDANELGVEGVTVNVIGSGGSTSVMTDANGDWSVGTALGSDLRVEFASFPSYFYPAKNGIDSPTSIQFINDGATGVTFGLHNPADFVNSVNPITTTPLIINGDGQIAGTAGAQDTLVYWNYGDDVSVTDTPTTLGQTYGTHAETGALWGVAYNPISDTLFSSSVLRRHSGFGPLGIGGIYTVDNARTAPSVANYLDLNTLAGVNVGVNPRTDAATDVCNALPGDTAGVSESWDSVAYQSIGTIGIGDIDLSEDYQTLYAVNLNSGELVATDATTGALRAGFPIAIPNPNGVACTSGEMRPWGLGVRDGVVYVGVVCSAENGGSTSDLKGHILTFDGASFDTTPVLSIDFDYTRSLTIFALPAEWQPWDVGTGATWHGDSFPQPIISDIAFDESGAMIIGILDRYAFMMGNNNYNYDPACVHPGGGTTSTTEGHSGGDFLRACPNGTGTWNIENNASCGGVTTSGVDADPGDDTVHIDEGPGGGEYYWQDGYGAHAVHTPDPNFNHRETSAGGLGILQGTNQVMATVYDPNSADANGIKIFDHTTGAADTRRYTLHSSEVGPGPHFGKSVGIGDIEFLTTPAPLEIGNRVWIDADHNGIQNPGEMPVENATVILYDGTCTEIARHDTDANGTWYFDSGTDGLLPNTDYYVIIEDQEFNPGGNLENYDPTLTGQGTILHDNQAVSLAGTCGGAGTLDGKIGLTYTTGGYGQNDHHLDMGFFQPLASTYDLALRKTLATGQSATVVQGGTVTFEIEVFNQGTTDATNVQITDYYPAELTYNTDNTASVLATTHAFATSVFATGTGTTFAITSIPASDSVTFEVTMNVSETFAGTSINWAEISVDDGIDIDSTPDTTNGSASGNGDGEDATAGGAHEDDQITENGTVAGQDEDDHDRASVIVSATPIFDLALRKTISLSSANIGDTVPFTITVFNQGLVAADNITVTDYIPDGLMLNDASWTSINASTAQRVLSVANGAFGAGGLLPSDSTEIIINLTIKDDATNNNLTNVAEISSATDVAGVVQTDIDSTPDSDAHNDTGGTVGDPNEDDIITDDGSIDEDDQDPATITLGTTLPPVGESCDEGSIGNQIWYDTDCNGEYTTDTEDGIEDFHVTLTFEDGTQYKDKTNSHGKYIFSNLPKGHYEVKIRNSDVKGWLQTADPGTDVEGNYNRTAQIDLGCNEERTDLDFGFTEHECTLAKTGYDLMCVLP